MTHWGTLPGGAVSASPAELQRSCHALSQSDTLGHAFHTGGAVSASPAELRSVTTTQSEDDTDLGITKALSWRMWLASRAQAPATAAVCGCLAQAPATAAAAVYGCLSQAPATASSRSAAVCGCLSQAPAIAAVCGCLSQAPLSAVDLAQCLNGGLGAVHPRARQAQLQELRDGAGGHGAQHVELHEGLEHGRALLRFDEAGYEAVEELLPRGRGRGLSEEDLAQCLDEGLAD